MAAAGYAAAHRLRLRAGAAPLAAQRRTTTTPAGRRHGVAAHLLRRQRAGGGAGCRRAKRVADHCGRVAPIALELAHSAHGTDPMQRVNAVKRRQRRATHATAPTQGSPAPPWASCKQSMCGRLARWLRKACGLVRPLDVAQFLGWAPSLDCKRLSAHASVVRGPSLTFTLTALAALRGGACRSAAQGLAALKFVVKDMP
jgi:hypothetical protein